MAVEDDCHRAPFLNLRLSPLPLFISWCSSTEVFARRPFFLWAHLITDYASPDYQSFPVVSGDEDIHFFCAPPRPAFCCLLCCIQASPHAFHFHQSVVFLGFCSPAVSLFSRLCSLCYQRSYFSVSVSYVVPAGKGVVSTSTRLSSFPCCPSLAEDIVWFCHQVLCCSSILPHWWPLSPLCLGYSTLAACCFAHSSWIHTLSQRPEATEKLSLPQHPFLLRRLGRCLLSLMVLQGKSSRWICGIRFFSRPLLLDAQRNLPFFPRMCTLLGVLCVSSCSLVYSQLFQGCMLLHLLHIHCALPTNTGRPSQDVPVTFLSRPLLLLPRPAAPTSQTRLCHIGRRVSGLQGLSQRTV